jgi:predicted NAD/FAD-binding protein
MTGDRSSPFLQPKPRVAVVGSGISGLGVVHTLAGQAQITLLEAGAYFGGHTNTVDVSLPDGSGQVVTHGVDTGFLVLNERTYPNLLRLFSELSVDLAKSDMSFSVQTPLGPKGEPLEWSGNNLSTVFSQRVNLLAPRFWRMLSDILRFNKLTTRLAQKGAEAELSEPMGAFLKRNGFSAEFADWYFLPMIGCIWSCPTDQMLQFPVATMIRFCHNHGLIQVTNRPQWWTVRGGARQYVHKIVGHLRASGGDARLNAPVLALRRDQTGVTVVSGQAGDLREERFDEVVLACHSDQALAILNHPAGTGVSPAERQLLGAIRYQPNVAVLHTDTSVMPKARRAWAAWNYERGAQVGREEARVCLHYWLNALQPLPFQQAVIVSLNPVREPDPAQVLARFEYEHPIFDGAAIEAQRKLASIQGEAARALGAPGHTWFAGAWGGYGFHEDGLKSGLAVARGLLQQWHASDSAAATPTAAALAA